MTKIGKKGKKRPKRKHWGTRKKIRRFGNSNDIYLLQGLSRIAMETKLEMKEEVETYLFRIFDPWIHTSLKIFQTPNQVIRRDKKRK